MMKNRDIEKGLKKEAQEHTPDLYDKIARSARAEGLLPEETAEAEIRQGDTVVLSSKKKRRITGAVMLFAAIFLCLAIVLPLLLKGTKTVLPQINVLSSNDVYGMGAVSTVKLLGGNTSAQAISKLSSVRSLDDEEDEEDDETDETTDANEAKAQAKKFNEYFTALDCFMGEDIVNTVSEANPDKNYPYETKLTINSKNFNGEAVQNVMYFTETPSSGDDGESFVLKGVLVVDGLDYYLEGERSFEEEDGETENELRIRAYADQTDKTSYVEMAQETSKEENETETEYVYSVYSKGRLIEQTAVEFEKEQEGSTEEVEYVLEFRQGEARGIYTVERETENGEACMIVWYEIEGEEGSFYVTQSSGSGYSYLFEDGAVLTF